MKAVLEEVVQQELDALGFDLFELRRGGTRQRPLLEVRIDRRDGAEVTIDDCARASRAIEARLDDGELVAPRYVLQVSSPGAERPLRTVADWRRFTGRWASVNSPALGGRQEVEILAVEGGDGSEVAVLRDASGDERRVALADVGDARLALRWTK
ncbi:MAG TPA: ribosome maturation factor RimP [Gemmatimonadaceae bacterium]|nr:ribosome maturation factor RimP [Gemmatimonadaceae bacterium]